MALRGYAGVDWESLRMAHCLMCGSQLSASSSASSSAVPDCSECHFRIGEFSSIAFAGYGEDSDPGPSAQQRGQKLNSKLLKHHPQRPFLFPVLLANQAIVTVDHDKIGYDGVLDDGTSLSLKCVDVDEPRLPERLYVWTHSAGAGNGNWITIGGRSTECGHLRPGDLLSIGSYAWIFHKYAEGQGYGLEPADPESGTSLQLENVRVSTRLNIASLYINAGEFVGIVGKSGSGKSTLIREIAERRVGTGTVKINGFPRGYRFDPAPSCVAYLPQQDIVHDDLTVEQQVKDYAQLIRSKVNDDVISGSLNIVGLRELAERYPSQLSGGQLRRSRLAAALARQASILLLDEPDSGLDPETALYIRRLLRTFSLLGTTVIVITHHRSSNSLFDRVIKLHDGKVERDLAPSSVDGSPPQNSATVGDDKALRLGHSRFLSQLPQLLYRAVLRADSVSFCHFTGVALTLPRNSESLSGCFQCC